METTDKPRALAGVMVLLGRICFAAIFVESGPRHFAKSTIGYASNHVPLAWLAVPISGVLAILGGLSVAVGYKAKWGAWMLVLFLVPVTLMLHNFWTLSGQAAQTNYIMFMKNVSMLGGALMVAYFGAGPMSVDACVKSHSDRGKP